MLCAVQFQSTLDVRWCHHRITADHHRQQDAPKLIERRDTDVLDFHAAEEEVFFFLPTEMLSYDPLTIAERGRGLRAAQTTGVDFDTS